VTVPSLRTPRLAQEAAGARTARSVRRPGGRSAATLFLLAVLTFCALSQAFRRAKPAAGIDYYQFWAVGRAIAHQQTEDLYSARGQAQLGRSFLAEAMRSSDPARRLAARRRLVLDTTATPFLYTMFATCSTANYTSSLRVFRALLLACFAFGVVGISTLLRRPQLDTLLSLTLLCLCFEPLASDLRVGNVGCLQLAGVVVYAWVRARGPFRFRALLAGAWMGLLIAFKPNLVFVAILLLGDSLLRRRWRQLSHESVGLALGGGMAVACSVAAIGNVWVWFDWLTALRRVPNESMTAAVGNYSPQALLGSTFGSLCRPLLAVAAVGSVALGLWLRAPKGQNSEGADAPEVHRVLWLLAFGCLVSLLLPYWAWLHYFVLAVPALFLALSPATRGTARTRESLRIFLAAAAWLALSRDLFSALGISITNAAYGALVVSATVALLVATVAVRPADASAGHDDSDSPHPGTWRHR
jgi:hypothetical protein